jgi:RimJ/RimL family protein N-acetyltransferase
VTTGDRARSTRGNRPVAFIKLPTARLILRDFRKNDWEAVHEYGADLEVVRYMPWGPNTEADTKEFIERSLASQREEPRTKFEFAVTLAESGRLIGGAGIRVSAPADRGGDMGYCLHPDFWGQGYATEAAAAIVGFGFGKLGLHRVFATCDTGNAASARVLEKVGMRREAHFRRDSIIRGEWRDSYLYAVLEDEWSEAGKGTLR